MMVKLYKPTKLRKYSCSLHLLAHLASIFQSLAIWFVFHVSCWNLFHLQFSNFAMADNWHSIDDWWMFAYKVAVQCLDQDQVCGGRKARDQKNKVWKGPLSWTSASSLQNQLILETVFFWVKILYCSQIFLTWSTLKEKQQQKTNIVYLFIC